MTTRRAVFRKLIKIRQNNEISTKRDFWESTEKVQKKYEPKICESQSTEKVQNLTTPSESSPRDLQSESGPGASGAQKP